MSTYEAHDFPQRTFEVTNNESIKIFSTFEITYLIDVH